MEPRRGSNVLQKERHARRFFQADISDTRVKPFNFHTPRWRFSQYRICPFAFDLHTQSPPLPYCSIGRKNCLSSSSGHHHLDIKIDKMPSSTNPSDHKNYSWRCLLCESRFRDTAELEEHIVDNHQDLHGRFLAGLLPEYQRCRPCWWIYKESK